MKGIKFCLVIGLIISVFIPLNLSAQNEYDALRLSMPGIGSNARALGMGNAYQALSDDFSAAIFNPAGFGLLRRLEIAGGIDYSKYSNNATFFGNETEYSNSKTKLNQLSFAFPFPTIRGSMVFAIGYHRDVVFNEALSFKGFNPGANSMIQTLLGQGDVSYLLYLTDSTGEETPINGQLNQEGTILSDGSIGRWSFSGAVEVSKDMFIGGTLNIVTGDYNRTRDYYEDDTRNIYGNNIETDPGNPNTRDFRSFYLNDILKWDLSGWDAKIGFLYQPTNYLRFGGSVQFPTTYNVKEEYTVNGESIFANSTEVIDPPLESALEYEISSPFIFSGGGAVSLYGLIVSGDVSYMDYSQMEFAGDGLTPSEISTNNRIIKETFTDVLNFNVGAEFTIPNIGLRVRGGFMYQPSPFKDDPSDYDRKYVTGGLGFLANETIAIDAAYVHGLWKDIGDNYGFNESRTFQDVTSNKLVLTLTYRF